jgi:hypothetical protein
MTTNDPVREAQQCHMRASSWLGQVFPELLRVIIAEESWRGRVDKQGNPFGSFYEFATYRLPRGLGLHGQDGALTYEDAIRYCEVMPANRGAAQLVRQQVPAVGGHGGKRDAGQGVENTLQRGSTNSTYLTARLKRDAPEIAERLAAGEFRSVRAAAIEAGIVKVPSVEDRIRKLWAKLDRKTQSRLWQELAEGVKQ